MSKVSLQGNISGSGTLTIAAPNTNSNYTLTLPAESGTLITSGGAIDVSASAPADSLVLDSSGNLGLGVTPSAWDSSLVAAQLGTGAVIEGSTSAGSLVAMGANYYAPSGGGYAYIGSDYASRYNQYQGAHTWQTAASGTAGNAISFTTAMTLDSSAQLLVNTTVNTNNSRFAIKNNDGSREWGFGTVGNNTSFYVLNNATTGVQVVNGATSWSSASDERLKDIIEPVTNAKQKLKQIRTVIGRYKKDKPEARRAFFLAQDWQKAMPEIVGEDSLVENETYLLMAYDQTPVLITAAVNELIHDFENIDQRLSDIEARLTAAGI